MKTDKPVSEVCPLCRKPYSGVPALSRTDNQTPICPDCGIRQALESIGVSTEEREKNPVCNAPKVPHVTVLFALCGLSERLPKNCPKSKSAPHRRTVRGLVGGCNFPRCLFHCTVFYHRKASLSSVRSTKYTAEISPYVLYI